MNQTQSLCDDFYPVVLEFIRQQDLSNFYTPDIRWALELDDIRILRHFETGCELS